MFLITQGKTNWKFLVIIIILAVVAGGGICWFMKSEKFNLPGLNIQNEVKDEIKTGKVAIDQNLISATQSSVDQGHQPWQLNPILVLRAYMTQYGFDPEKDLDNMIVPSTSTQAEFGKSINEFSFKVNHEGETYAVTLVQPVPGPDKIWTISEIEFKKDETADWQTYRNEEYGFEFKYPSVPLGCEQCKIYESSEGFNVNTTDFVIKDAGGLGLSDFVDKEMQGFTIEKREKMLIGGRSGIAIDYRFGGMDRFGSIAFVEKNNKVFIFSFTAGGFCCDPKVDMIYEAEVYGAMLSTFRFLE